MTKRVFTSLTAIPLFLIAGATLAAETSAPTKVRVACVGDSITYGARLRNRSKRHYPRQLGRLLGENYVVGNFGDNGTNLINKGGKPWTTQPICKKAMAFEPDIVVINLGANDTQDRNIGKHPDDFVPDYLALIKRFRALPSEPIVYVCNPVEVFSHAGGIRYDVMEKEIRPRIKTVAERSKCPVIDLKTPFVKREDLMADKVHPNYGGATLMAKVVAETITKKHPDKAEQAPAEDTPKAAPEK